MLQGAAPRLGLDQFDAAVFAQLADVVADVADPLAERLGELARAGRALVQHPHHFDPDRMTDRFGEPRVEAGLVSALFRHASPPFFLRLEWNVSVWEPSRR